MGLFDRFREDDSDDSGAESGDSGGIQELDDSAMRNIAFQAGWRCSHCRTPEWQSDLFLIESEGREAVACESCARGERRELPSVQTGYLGYQIPGIDEVEVLKHRERGEVEVKITDTDGGVWAGEHPRQMIESRYGEQPRKLWLGHHKKGNRIRDLGIDFGDLWTHIWCQGTTGGGKSTWALFALMQLIWDGSGICLIDPHGDLVEDVLQRIPPHRRDDVVVFEPGSTQSDHHVPLNLLDIEAEPGDEDYHERVSSAVADVRSGMRRGGDWGQRMGPINDNLARGMVMHEDDHTFIDYREILLDEDRRRQFARELDQQGFYAADYTAKIAEMGDVELSPLVRRLEEWTSSKIVRDMISEPRSEISFEEVIKDQKILLCNVNLPDQSVQRMVSSAIIRRLWRVAKSQPKGQRRPFVALCDEFDDVLNSEMNMADILSNARKFKFGMILMSQYIQKLDDRETEKAVQKLCNTKISFRDPDGEIEGDSDSTLSSLADYTALVRMRVGGKMKGPYKMRGFAPYPPRRSQREADEWFRQPALRRYGVPREGAGPTVSREQQQTALKAILDAQVRDDTGDGVALADARETLVRRLEDFDGHPAGADEIIQQIPAGADDGDIERWDDDGQTRVRITARGRQQIWDDGHGVGSGGIAHEQLLRDAHRALTRAGGQLEAITQTGGQQPDATLSVDEQSDLIERLTGGDVAYVEAESATGKADPAQTCQNVAAAVNDDKHCLILCRPDTAPKVERTLTDPPFRSQRTANGQHRLYHMRDLVIDGHRMLRPDDAVQTVWVPEPDGEGFILMDSDGTEHHRFGSPKAVFEDWGAYPAAIPTDTEIPDGKKAVKSPFIPERELNDGIPEQDAWDIIVVPGDRCDQDERELAVYHDGDQIPLDELLEWEKSKDSEDIDQTISELRDIVQD